MTETFHNKKDHAFVASTSDGTIITLHYYKNKHHSPTQPELCWGLSSKMNKIRLPHSACNIGLIDACDSNANSIVACLRDGSVFILPVCSLDNSDDEYTEEHLRDSRIKVTFYNLSQNTNHKSDENIKSYTQGFAAGYVRVRNWNENGEEYHSNLVQNQERSVLLIFHAWACGWIDCHCCSMIPTQSPKSMEIGKKDIPKDYNVVKSPLAEILERSVLEELVSYLLSLDLSNESVHEDSIFVEASKECKALGENKNDVFEIISSAYGGEGTIKSLESFSKLIDHLIFFGDDRKDDLFLRK